MLRKFTAVKGIIQAVFVLLYCIGLQVQATSQEKAHVLDIQQPLSLLGINKVFLYVQNSQLKITPSTEEKREIKIHSNSNSLLNKIKLKQIKKAKTLHIWIFKDSFLSNYKTINDRPSIGFVNIQMPIMPIVVQQSLYWACH